MSLQRTYTLLHTEWSDGWGGQERRILGEMTGMAARGHRVLLACRAKARLVAEARAAGIAVHIFPFAGKFHLPTIMGLKRFIKAEGIELVNTHSGIDSWTAGIAARLAGVTLVRTRHLYLPLKRHFVNFVHYLPHAFVTCGESMRVALIAEGFPCDHVSSIPTGIDFSTFCPSAERAQVRMQLGLSPQTFMILMVGVIRGVKRHEIALRALARLRKTLPDCALVLAGEGPMRIDMERLAAELHISEYVHFLGHRDDIPNLLHAADCLLLTSRSEGVPQAITQALGCGVPVVATAVGSVPELIYDNKTGLLIPPESFAAAADALLRLAQDKSLAEVLASAGKQHAQTHYSQAAMLDATEALYARLLSTRGSAS